MAWSAAVAQWSLTLAAVAATGAPQQLPPRDARPVSAATASVRGRVTDKDTGVPIPHASVQLSRPGGATRRVFEAWTDRDGRYEIPALPAGEYFASAAPGEYRAGYQPQSYLPERNPAIGAAAPLPLAPGERRVLDFQLPRTFAIEGRVLNDYGEPLAEVQVSAERVDRGGTVQRTVRTDDRGYFRLYGLPPGLFRVCAAGDGPADRVTGGETVATRYVRSCVPAADAPEEGITLTAADAPGVTIQMRRGGAFTISGRVVDETGAAVDNATLQLYPVTPAGAPLPSAHVQVIRGAFSARGVTPGEYALRAMVYPSDPYEPATPQQRVGYATVRVDTADVDGIVVVTGRGADVAGQVVFEGGARPSASGAPGPQVQFRLDIEAQPVYRMEPFVSAAIRAGGRFDARRLRGPRIVGISGLPPGWIVKSVRYRGAEIVDVSTEFSNVADAGELSVVVGPGGALLAGQPVDEKAQFVEDAVPFLIPAAPEQWKAGPIALPLVRDVDNPPRPRTVRPGEYFAGALSSAEFARLSRSVALIARVAATAPRITIAENDARGLQLRVRRLAEFR